MTQRGREFLAAPDILTGDVSLGFLRYSEPFCIQYDILKMQSSGVGMDLAITNIHGQGDYKSEYVWFLVKNDCNLGDYLLADDTFGRGGAASNKLRHVYFFPKKEVKKGERVALRTRVGKDHEDTLESGEKVHRFYWNLKHAVWNDNGDCAHLLKAPANQRQAVKVPAIEK